MNNTIIIYVGCGGKEIIDINTIYQPFPENEQETDVEDQPDTISTDEEKLFDNA